MTVYIQRRIPHCHVTAITYIQNTVTGEPPEQSNQQIQTPLHTITICLLLDVTSLQVDTQSSFKQGYLNCLFVSPNNSVKQRENIRHSLLQAVYAVHGSPKYLSLC